MSVLPCPRPDVIIDRDTRQLRPPSTVTPSPVLERKLLAAGFELILVAPLDDLAAVAEASCDWCRETGTLATFPYWRGGVGGELRILTTCCQCLHTEER